MKTQPLIMAVALAMGALATLPAQAHERFRFGSGCPEPLGTGACVTGAIGSHDEPAREDEPNGLDFFLFYEDGSEDGNVISTRGGDEVKFEFVKFLFLKEDKLDAEVLNEQPMPLPTEAFGEEARYQNNVRYVDDGAIGYVVKACFQDLVEQEDESPAENYVPMAEPLCIDQKWVCGEGSQDPRNDPDDPEFDDRFHQFGCVFDSEPFGAKPPEKNGIDRRKDRDNDKFSLESPEGD